MNVLCYHGNKSTILLFIQFLEQLLKFLVNLTLLKYVKSQRNYGFLITKELILAGFKSSLLSLLKGELSSDETLTINVGMDDFGKKIY